MVKASTEPLKPNPYLTYRDPVTGLWVVVKNSLVCFERNDHQQNEPSFSLEKKSLLS